MRAFEDFDVDDSGEIDKDEFHEGLAKFGLTMTLHEADLILKRFVGRRANHVLYRDFVRMIEDRSTYVTDGGRTRYRVDEAAVINVRRALRALGDHLRRRVLARVRRVRRERRQEHPRSEFRRGMEQLDLRLSSSEIKDVLDVFDADGGEISYQEFVAFCREEDTELLDRVRSEFVRLADAGPYASRTGVPSMRPVFQEFDRSHRGCITRHEFKQGVQLLGLKLSQREVEQVLQHLDADGNGEISYIEFETFVDEHGSYDDRGSEGRPTPGATGTAPSAAAVCLALEEVLRRAGLRRIGGAVLHKLGACDIGRTRVARAPLERALWERGPSEGSSGRGPPRDGAWGGHARARGLARAGRATGAPQKRQPRVELTQKCNGLAKRRSLCGEPGQARGSRLGEIILRCRSRPRNARRGAPRVAFRARQAQEAQPEPPLSPRDDECREQERGDDPARGPEQHAHIDAWPSRGAAATVANSTCPRGARRSVAQLERFVESGAGCALGEAAAGDAEACRGGGGVGAHGGATTAPPAPSAPSAAVLQVYREAFALF